MTDKLFPEDNEKTQMMAAPPPLNPTPVVTPSTPEEQTRLFSSNLSEEISNLSNQANTNNEAPNFGPTGNSQPSFATASGNGSSGNGASSAGASGRAITALVLAIASFLCCGFFTGIPALILGRMEEGAINRGEAPEAGRMLAKIGWILGLIATILNCLTIVIIGAYMLLVGGTVGSGFMDIMKQAQQQDTHFRP